MVVLADDHPAATGPDAWPRARELLRRAHAAVFHAAGGRAGDGAMIAAATATSGRMLPAEMEMEHRHMQARGRLAERGAAAPEPAADRAERGVASHRQRAGRHGNPLTATPIRLRLMAEARDRDGEPRAALVVPPSPARYGKRPLPYRSRRWRRPPPPSASRRRSPMPGSLDPSVVAKPAKIRGLLGSAHDGGRSAAAWQATRLLQARGLSWADVFAPPPTPQRPPHAPHTVEAQWALRFYGRLTSRERKFLADIGRCRRIGAKQAAALDGILRKLGRDAP